MIAPIEGKPGERMTLPFYPLSDCGDPMYCVCDHGGQDETHWCGKCPFRAEHREAAFAELRARLEGGGV